MTHTDTAKNPSWSWLVILAVISLAIAAVFWAVERVGDTDEDAIAMGVPADNDGANSETSSPVQDYLQFAGAAGDRQIRDSDADPDAIVEGLRKLAGALGTLNLGSSDLQVDLRVAAEHFLLNSASTATAAAVRNSLISAADAIEAERRNEVNLRRLAESVRRDRPLLDRFGRMDRQLDETRGERIVHALEALSGKQVPEDVAVRTIAHSKMEMGL